MTNYRLSLETKTLTITKAFEEAVAKGEGTEYELYTKLMREIPDLKVVRRTHKTPSKYTTKSGEKFDRNQYKNITYDMMERVLPQIGNKTQIDNFNLLRGIYNGKSNGYKIIRDWFLGEFPDFRKNPLSYIIKTAVEAVPEKAMELTVEEKAA